MSAEHEEALERTGYWGNRAGGAMFFCTTTNRFMVVLRSDEVLQPNTIGVIGGAIDSGEDVEEAILREIHEETGISPNSSNLIGLKELFIYKDGSFRYYNFLALVREEFVPELNWENSEHYWLTYAQLKSQKNLHFGMTAMFEDAECDRILNKLTD